MSSKIWPSFTRENPCPACNHFDWTCRAGEKKFICMRVPSEHVAKDGGYYHEYGDKKEFVLHVPQMKFKPAPKVNLDCDAQMEIWRNKTSTKDFETLANELNVSVYSLQQLDMVSTGNGYAFPMCDGEGKTIGIQLRGKDKKCVTGSRLGLFIPSMEAERVCCVCEGVSDCAALITMGFYSIARPSCATGGEMLKTAFKRLSVRQVVIIADNDCIKKHGGRPGYDGAKKLKKELGLPSFIFNPPSPLKDVREMLNKLDADASRDILNNAIQSAIWTR